MIQKGIEPRYVQVYLSVEEPYCITAFTISLYIELGTESAYKLYCHSTGKSMLE